MTTLLRFRTALAFRPSSGASSSQCRSFQVSAPSQATPPKKNAVKKVVGKRAQSIGGIMKNKKQRTEATGPRKPEVHAIIKLDHPLFKAPTTGRSLPMFDPVELPAHIGKPMNFPTVHKSPIHVFGMPETLKKEFLHTQQPFSIVRNATIEVLDELDALASPGSEKSNRLVLTGPSGCGKSVLLLQAVHSCVQNNWIVYYVPHGIDWMNASSPYAFDYRSQIFHQHALASDALSKMLQLNQARLSQLQLSEDVPQPGGKPGAVVKEGTSLEALMQYGIKDPLLAPQTLILLFEALGKQTQFPVLIAVDDFQALYNTSAYRDPQFKFINSYHLSMPRLILEYASGKRQLKRGAVVGAVSQTHTTYPIIDPLRKALELEWPGDRTPTPYDHARASFSDFTTGLRNYPVPAQFSTSEAASLMDAWDRNRMFHSSLNDSFFLAKYTETGGNPRALVRKGVMATLQA